MKTALHAEHALTNARYQQFLRVTSILLILTSAQNAVLALLYARRKPSACRSKLIFHHCCSSWNESVDLLRKTKPHCLLDVTVRLFLVLFSLCGYSTVASSMFLFPLRKSRAGMRFLPDSWSSVISSHSS